MLGTREPEIYGSDTLESIILKTNKFSNEIGIHLDWKQSNSEGEIIDWIQSVEKNGYNALIINPGAYSHTSIAILDALNSIKVKKIEVHLSNTNKREEFRKTKITAKASDYVLEGLGSKVYSVACFTLSLEKGK